MTRYLRPDLLQLSGTARFDDWAATFGNVTQQNKLTATGQLQLRTSFSSFKNMIPVWALIFYIFRDNLRMKALLFTVASVVLQTALFYKNYGSFIEFSYMYGTLLALIPLGMYSGERGGGRHKKLSRWFFYVYYPAHMATLIMAVLVGIRLFK